MHFNVLASFHTSCVSTFLSLLVSKHITFTLFTCSLLDKQPKNDSSLKLTLKKKKKKNPKANTQIQAIKIDFKYPCSARVLTNIRMKWKLNVLTSVSFLYCLEPTQCMDNLNEVVLGHYTKSDEVWMLDRRSPYTTANPKITFDLYLWHTLTNYLPW